MRKLKKIFKTMNALSFNFSFLFRYSAITFVNDGILCWNVKVSTLFENKMKFSFSLKQEKFKYLDGFLRFDSLIWRNQRKLLSQKKVCIFSNKKVTCLALYANQNWRCQVLSVDIISVVSRKPTNWHPSIIK